MDLYHLYLLAFILAGILIMKNHKYWKYDRESAKHYGQLKIYLSGLGLSFIGIIGIIIEIIEALK